MADNVVEFDGITRLDIPAERILKRALDAGLTQVVIMGYDAEGDEFFASSVADGGAVLWMMERSKMKLLQVSE